MDSVKQVLVTDKRDRVLSRTTKERAKRLVSRNRAKWVGKNHIQLLIGHKEQKQIQRQVNEEAGGVCYICGREMQPGDVMTIDHVIPKIIGGKDEKWNLRCCCYECNNDKGCQPIRSYVKRMKQRPDLYPRITPERIIILEDFVDKFYKENLL